MAITLPNSSFLNGKHVEWNGTNGRPAMPMPVITSAKSLLILPKYQRKKIGEKEEARFGIGLNVVVPKLFSACFPLTRAEIDSFSVLLDLS